MRQWRRGVIGRWCRQAIALRIGHWTGESRCAWGELGFGMAQLSQGPDQLRIPLGCDHSGHGPSLFTVSPQVIGQQGTRDDNERVEIWGSLPPSVAHGSLNGLPQ